MSTWQEIAAKKRADREVLLSPFKLPESELPPPDQLNVYDFISSGGADSLLLDKDKEITEIDDVDELAAKIAAGTYTASEVIRAYIKRATVAHQLTNCFSEVVFEQALERAKFLDEYYAKEGKPIGRYHGVPLTLKDQFNVHGVDTTLGYVGRSNNPVTDKSKEAVLVTIFEKEGAVVIAKTNLPQSIMWCECNNPLWGLTVHPRRRDFTPGGSTGGEGALLALKGSVMGWGTDLGGSVRIPQVFNGGYGLRPSAWRIPYEGVPVTIDGQEHVPSVIGPMTRTLNSLTSITKAVIENEPWKLDPKCIPIPWRQELYNETLAKKKFIFGVMRDDGVVRVHPPIARTLDQAVERLRAAGHEVVEWNAPELHAELVPILNKFYIADGGEDVKSDVNKLGEPLMPYVERMVNRGPPISIPEYWHNMVLKRDFQKKYLDKWNASGALTSTGEPIDFILAPGCPHTAVPVDKTSWVGYTRVWNGLDYTTTVFPVSTVDREIDALTEEQKAYIPRNEWDEANWPVYNPDTMHGLPVNLQIIGGRLAEEKTLAVTKIVEEILQGL
ncbi:amidase signature domain-containing protein [Kockiozyma suomiensis]|uniref:amidase signature domain-containing protein n=1 Tax=Kockiozyma suomiensis TaxID=1337062 RepID=UPI00334369E7